MDSASPSDDFDSTRDTGSARTDAPVPVTGGPAASPARTPSNNHGDASLLDITRYTRFKDQTSVPPCFLCLYRQEDPDDSSIFGAPTEGLSIASKPTGKRITRTKGLVTSSPKPVWS